MIKKLAVLFLSMAVGSLGVLPAMAGGAEFSAPGIGPVEQESFEGAPVHPKTPVVSPGYSAADAPMEEAVPPPAASPAKPAGSTAQAAPQAAPPAAERASDSTSGAAEVKSYQPPAASSAPAKKAEDCSVQGARSALDAEAGCAPTDKTLSNGSSGKKVAVVVHPSRAVNDDDADASRDNKKVVSRVGGGIAGAPRAVCRQSVNELKASVDDLTKGSRNPLLVVPAALISLPFCLVAGVTEGLVGSLKPGEDEANALSDSERKRLAGLPSAARKK